jgi:uncharacterized membrane protein
MSRIVLPIVGFHSVGPGTTEKGKLAARAMATPTDGGAVDYLGKAVHQVTGLATKIVGHRSSSGGRSQTVTIGRSREEIDQFWRDPEQLSLVLGHIATVRSPENDIFEWMLSAGPAGTQTWRTRLLASDHGLRFVDDAADTHGTGDRAEVVVTYRPGPNGLGTEVTLEAATPFPDFLTGAALFTVLYRTRALLQTGEVPTLSHNPSARDAAH